MEQYDYIISGSGAAGMSLLMRLMQQPAFENKKILVVDKVRKEQNDHTWCFWEKQPGLFEPVVHHKWDKLHFHSNYFSSPLLLTPYQYKMIRSSDLYNWVYKESQQHPNIEFLTGTVEAAGNAGDTGLVVVDGKQYTAGYVFNSILFNKPQAPLGKHYLLQHFKGFVIETKEAIFDPGEATLMDFRVNQQNGTSFVYVLPTANNQALVEYTLFSPRLLEEAEYNSELQRYISDYLSVKEYTIKEEEYGIIPMTNMKFVKRVGNVINMGTAGGQTKASSGYTFQFIQKHANRLVADLLQHGCIKNNESFFEKRFNFYDSTLLNILSGNKLAGDKIFADLFSKNPVDRVLRFLDNESSVEDEINLVGTLPQGVFAKAAIQELFK